MGKKEDRINKLADFIKTENGASVKELANMFHVSEMTIRRDIKVLSDNGIVKNLYGSTIYNPDKTTEFTSDYYYLSNANTTHYQEKEAIGKYAASLVTNDDILIIDTGSTTFFLATHLDESLDIKVLCYSSNIVNALLTKPDLSIIMAGGYYHKNTQMFESDEGINLIKNTRATKAFISAAGVHDNLGITCANNYEYATKRAIIESSCERILLIDSSKFSKVNCSFFANLDEFDTIITDDGISYEWVHFLKKIKRIKLIIVPVKRITTPE